MSIKRLIYNTYNANRLMHETLSNFWQGALLCLLLAYASCNQAAAQDITDNLLAKQPECLPAFITPPLQPPAKTTKPYHLSADQLQQPDSNTYSLLGNAKLLAPGRIILAKQLNFNRLAQQANAFGRVRLIQPDILITAHRLNLNKKTQTASITDALYQLLPSRAYGQAKTVQTDRKTQITVLKNATFTTCPLRSHLKFMNGSLYQTAYDHNVAWELSAEKIRLDQQKRRVYGYNTWLHFYHVPIFYTPYFNFSLDDRDSGLLFPYFGVHRSINNNSPNAYWLQPYYFNLAPNYDDTLNIYAIQDRGLLLDNEFRYLNKVQQFTFNLSGIQDQVVKREGLKYFINQEKTQTGPKQMDRWRMKLDAQQHWNSQWQSEIHWQKVSDYAFYSDLPIDSTLTDATTAPRRGSIQYHQNGAHDTLEGKLTVADSLRIRPTASYNYEQKPNFNLYYQHTFGLPLKASLLTDITEFQISHPGLNKPEGTRQYLQPKLDYRLDKPYGYIEPMVQLNLLQYRLENTQNFPKDPPSVAIPQYAIKGGLIFERTFFLNQLPLTQTLKPELQWLYTPYVKQNQNPLFDTGAQTLNFSNLFSLNRFSGFDRIGDTHQLSASLTTEIYTQDHQQQLTAAIGQTFYYDDRKVTLTYTPIEPTGSQTPPSPSQPEPLSDYYTQLTFLSPHFQFSNTGLWKRDTAVLDAANSRLLLKFPPKLTFMLNNQTSDLTQPKQKKETLSGGLLWQPNGKWQLGSYMEYDYTQNLKTDNGYAIQYQNCCWSAELSLHEYQRAENMKYYYGFQFMIQFKGFSTAGEPFAKRLKQKFNF